MQSRRSTCELVHSEGAGCPITVSHDPADTTGASGGGRGVAGDGRRIAKAHSARCADHNGRPICGKSYRSHSPTLAQPLAGDSEPRLCRSALGKRVVLTWPQTPRRVRSLNRGPMRCAAREGGDRQRRSPAGGLRRHSVGSDQCTLVLGRSRPAMPWAVSLDPLLTEVRSLRWR